MLATALTTPALAHGGGLNACAATSTARLAIATATARVDAACPCQPPSCVQLGASAWAAAYRLGLSENQTAVRNHNCSLSAPRAEWSGGSSKTSISIAPPAAQVWDALVKPDLIKQYMFGTTLSPISRRAERSPGRVSGKARPTRTRARS